MNLLPLLFAFACWLPQEDVTTRKLVVVASQPALASIVSQIGGDRVTVTSVSQPTWDVHSVQAKPSVFALLREADLFVHSGLDLEMWTEPAIKASRNSKLRLGEPNNIDCSEGIKLLDVPENPSRVDGDVHIYGNPHYWLDPLNARTIATTIAAGLAGIDPGSAKLYMDNRDAFDQDIRKRLKGWLVKVIPKKNTPIVVYHDSFPYFTRRFGLRTVATVEPKPRITPTQSHLLEVIRAIEGNQVKMVLREPFHDEDATDFLKDRTGVKVVTVSTMPGFREGVETYQDLIDWNIKAILGALN